MRRPGAWRRQGGEAGPENAYLSFSDFRGGRSDVTLELGIVEVFVASAASSSGVSARAKPKAGQRGGAQGSSGTLRANAGDGDGATGLPRARGRSLPVMKEPCEHALAADPRLLKGANATHRYITCHRCLPGQFGIHVAKAWRNDGEQLWRYFMASLLFTPKGRTIFPVGDPT